MLLVHLTIVVVVAIGEPPRYSQAGASRGNRSAASSKEHDLTKPAVHEPRDVVRFVERSARRQFEPDLQIVTLGTGDFEPDARLANEPWFSVVSLFHNPPIFAALPLDADHLEIDHVREASC